MMRTLSQMLANLYDDLRVQSTDTTSTTRLTRYLNDGHEYIVRRPAFTQFRQFSLPLTTVADRAVYGLPQAFARVDKITEPSNGDPLGILTLAEWREIDPQDDASGSPTHRIDLGFQAVMLQPNSTGLWIVSTAAGDTTQTCRVRGLRANGDLQSDVTATLNGTTRVALGSATDYVAVRSLRLSAVGVGVISLYDAASGGNELARIPVGLTSVQYLGVRFWPTPTAALTYTVDGQVSAAPLSLDTDISLLPEEFDELLETYARRRWAKWIGDPVRYALENDELEREIARMKTAIEFPPGTTARVGGRESSVRTSNLPGNFPND